MAPTALTTQVTTLLTHFSGCLQLCTTIQSTRRLGSTHRAFDNLQTGLTLSSQSISTSYSTARKLLGSRMEVGDETSRSVVREAILDIEDIKSRLHEIARGERGNPGFNELLRQVERIEDSVSSAVASLGRRLQAAKPALAPKRKDEITVSTKELDMLVAHMKNSWLEKVVAGRTVWVNALDEKRIVLDYPVGGFVKGKERKVVRTPTWEQEEIEREERARRNRRSRDDVWDGGRGY